MKKNYHKRNYHEATDLNNFFSQNIILWFRKNKRKLPWRVKSYQKDFTYKVLVSEFMLQQTIVKTAIPYFEKFIKKWPSIKSLSKAKEQEILILWQGLGYYNRARNLLKTSKIIMSKFNGKIPQTEKELISLPGIGDYSAAAIRSIGFDEKAVAIDGNVKRVISRFFGLKGTLDKNINEIKELSYLVCSDSNNRNYTQGVMEFGAIVCKPKKPLCTECIISKKCTAFITNQVASIPMPKIRSPKKKLRCITYLAIKNKESVLLKQRKNKKILKNQWELPSSDWQQKKITCINSYSPLKNIKWNKSSINFNHSFSHVDLKNSVYVSKIGKSLNFRKENKVKWVLVKNLSKYPLTTMSKKTLQMYKLI